LPAAADLRPKGPVEITADRTEAVEGTTAIYSGHVNLVSDTLKLDGDRLELKQSADHSFAAKVTGAPAHMSHAGSGTDNPAMSAHAKTLNYDSRTGLVDLIGDAFVDRSGDTTSADTIRYSLLDRSLQATGGSQQVHIVIQPPPSAASAAAPATSSAPPAAAPPAATAPVPTAPPAAAPATSPKPPATGGSATKKAASAKKSKGQNSR
jgi:lipopolysaccharide transport protein LptA